jgi:hypothetical protein
MFSGHFVAYKGHLNPVLHHQGLVCTLHALVPQRDCDDTGGHLVELSDSGMDGRCKISLAVLVPEGDKISSRQW